MGWSWQVDRGISAMGGAIEFGSAGEVEKEKLEGGGWGGPGRRAWWGHVVWGS